MDEETKSRLVNRLGRVPSPIDIRDLDHTMEGRLSLLRRIILPRSKYWAIGTVLDQGDTPHCVGFSWDQWQQTSPVRIPRKEREETLDHNANGHAIYADCKRIDNYSGPGTFVRAGAEVMRSRGRLTEYLWAQSLDGLKTWVLSKGPVVVGTVWTNDMFDPDVYGRITPTGAEAGGHAYMIYGYGRSRDQFRIVNSWGPNWGEGGRAWIDADHMWSLIMRRGEACTAAEIKR